MTQPDRDALRPPCPTCGGTGKKADPADYYADLACPDCVDGRMPFERMARIVNAVFADDILRSDYPVPFLRGIR